MSMCLKSYFEEKCLHSNNKYEHELDAYYVVYTEQKAYIRWTCKSCFKKFEDKL